MEINTKAILRIVVIAQCAGMIALAVFQNGFIVAYLSKFNLSSPQMLLLLSIPQAAIFLFMLPSAFLSDRFGKKKIGYLGLWLTVVGYVIIIVTGFPPFNQFPNEWVLGTGIATFGAGFAMFGSSWFGLLKPLVPDDIRGRFFGKLRAAWQLVAILFAGGVTFILKTTNSLPTFQIIIGVITLLLIVRILCYTRIPELDKQPPSTTSFLEAFKFVLTIPNYLAFSCYMFLLMLFVGACPLIFNLMQKAYLNFSDDEIVLMGNLLAFGSFIGYYFGGKMVDRFGTKPVFLISHFLFFSVILVFLIRDLIPFPVMVVMGGVTILYGYSLAASSVASTTEMLLIIPPENISLSSSLNLSMIFGGTALSGVLSSQLLDLGVLNSQWFLLGNTMNEFDAILLISGVMVILLIVTLGLIPSVTGQSRLIPSGQI